LQGYVNEFCGLAGIPLRVGLSIKSVLRNGLQALISKAFSEVLQIAKSVPGMMFAADHPSYYKWIQQEAKELG
jgi:hypothetical protein